MSRGCGSVADVDPVAPWLMADPPWLMANPWLRGRWSRTGGNSSPGAVRGHLPSSPSVSRARPGSLQTQPKTPGPSRGTPAQNQGPVWPLTGKGHSQRLRVVNRATGHRTHGAPGSHRWPDFPRQVLLARASEGVTVPVTGVDAHTWSPVATASSSPMASGPGSWGGNRLPPSPLGSPPSTGWSPWGPGPQRPRLQPHHGQEVRVHPAALAPGLRVRTVS